MNAETIFLLRRTANELDTVIATISEIRRQRIRPKSRNNDHLAHAVRDLLHTQTAIRLVADDLDQNHL